MERKELKIEIPSGYVIDEANSTFECIKFKPKSLTYEDIAKVLFKKGCYYINLCGSVVYSAYSTNYAIGPNSATSEKQLEKLLAINKLMNVAKYLNGDWKPDWDNYIQDKFFFEIKEKEKEIRINATRGYNLSFCYFKSEKVAQQAIDILREETIRLALSTDW